MVKTGGEEMRIEDPWGKNSEGEDPLGKRLGGEDPGDENLGDQEAKVWLASGQPIGHREPLVQEQSGFSMAVQTTTWALLVSNKGTDVCINEILDLHKT